MTDIAIAYVDVLVLRPSDRGYDVLCLHRGKDTKRPGTWEIIHGKIDEGENPAVAARREMQEETGLATDKFYNLSRVHSFYEHKTDRVVLIPAFAAIVPRDAQVKLSEEHDEFAWLQPEGAPRRLAWPREAQALVDALQLLKGGSAGALEDTLRVD